MKTFIEFILEEVWDEPNPNKKHKKLSSSKRAKAKARAKAADRPYPNLIDNMAVAKEEAVHEAGPRVMGVLTNPQRMDAVVKKRTDASNQAVDKYETNRPANPAERQASIANQNRLAGRVATARGVASRIKPAPAPISSSYEYEGEEVISERGEDSKGYYRATEKGAGLTKKGAAHFGIQTAVTEKDPKGKRASRRKSFCARMSGMPGPMKDEKGRPTRKAMSLRRWRCR